MSKLYLEHGHFLEIAGEHYCIKDSCEGCQYQQQCQNETEETYTDFTPPIRHSVRTTKDDTPYSPYPKDITDKPLPNRQFKGNILPQTKKRVFKVIIEHPEIDTTDFIVYQAPTDKYYCLKQQCKGCKYNPQCKRELEIVDDNDLIMVIDFKNQEPRAFALTTLTTNNREWNWDDVFRNDSIREQGQIYKTLETLFKYHGIDTTVKNVKFNEWCDTRFFRDRTQLYDLQQLVCNHYAEKSDESLKRLKQKAQELLNDYEQYQIQHQANRR